MSRSNGLHRGGVGKAVVWHGLLRNEGLPVLLSPREKVFFRRHVITADRNGVLIYNVAIPC